MTVFGRKVLKAYVILLWSGAVPGEGGGGNGALYMATMYMCAYILQWAYSMY